MKMALIRLRGTYSNWYRKPLLGVAYVSAAVNQSGHHCRIFDAYINSWSDRELVTRVREYGPDVVGITALTHEINRADAMALQIKHATKAVTVIGGCHVTAMPERTLAEFRSFDYGVFGEGEKTSVELLGFLEKGGDPHSIKGLAWRPREGGIRANQPRPPLTSEELTALPFPDVEACYGNNSRALSAPDAAYPIFTTRGCPNQCSFCMRVLGSKVRRRSVESIIAEIERAIDRWGAHAVTFCDEIFLFDCAQTREVLHAMIEKGISKRIKWSGHTRANLVNPGIIALAKKAGCGLLTLGVESGNDEILKRVKKGITVQQVKDAVSTIHEAGIAVVADYILGHPGETRQTARQTVDLAIGLNTFRISVGIMVPYPGTEIYAMALHGEGGYRLLTHDWSHYDKYAEQSMEFEGVPFQELLRLQRRAMLGLFLKNHRWRDGIRFIWQKRNAVYYLMKRCLSIHGETAPPPACDQA